MTIALTIVLIATFCAAGSAGAAASWSIVTGSNNGAMDNALTAVSCTSTKFCMSVGSYTTPGVQHTLAERWNGKQWSIAPSPSPGGVRNELSAVSCTSSSSCTAVGRFESDNGVDRTLAEQWNGQTWSVRTTANRGTAANSFAGVSCVSPTSCTAVGVWSASGIERTLVERWNGSAWTVDTTSASPGESFSALVSVSCVAPTSCRAVGDYLVGNLARTLAESWNGKTWTVTPSPNRSGSANALAGISCTSAASCHAVGSSTAGGLGRALTESWNGKTWTVDAAAGGGATAPLLAISCATKVCKAVGYTTAGGVDRTHVESYDGHGWTVEASPNPPAGKKGDLAGARGARLSGVSCFPKVPCATVGRYVGASGADRTLVESHG